MNHKKTLPLIFLIIAATGVFAQQTDEVPADIQAYVTGVHAEARNNLIRLTWTDSPDTRGPVYIFASTVPFGGDVEFIPGIPVAVPYGMESYIFEIDDPGIYHYHVAAGDEAGLYYYVNIRYDNIITIQIEEEVPAETAETAPVEAETTRRSDTSGTVSGLRAVVDNDRVVINFRAESDASLVLYRSIRPIRNAPDLLGAVIIQSNIRSPCTDFPVPGIPYYYAVVQENELTRGNIRIQPGVNATTEPAQLAFEKTAETRSVPLPLISLTADSQIAAQSVIPAGVELSSETRRILENIPSHRSAGLPPAGSRIFGMDLEASGGGEEYLLGSIVQGPFRDGEWEAARDELTQFINIPRSRAIEARTRFYLGQCMYFMNSPREALFEFLSARSVYPDESAEWIQAALRMMTD